MMETKQKTLKFKKISIFDVVSSLGVLHPSLSKVKIVYQLYKFAKSVRK